MRHPEPLGFRVHRKCFHSCSVGQS